MRAHDERPVPAAAADWDERVDDWETAVDTPVFRRICERVYMLAEAQPEDIVVDLGAGTGLLALRLAPSVQEVVAVDASPAMLERLCAHAASSGLDNVRPVVADLRSLPLDDASVTLAVSNYAFHHLDGCGKELALAELRRVLAPGGRLVICDMMFSLTTGRRDRRILLSKVAAIARRGPAGWLRLARNLGRLVAGRWEQPATLAQWRTMLRRRGFEQIRCETLEAEAAVVRARRPL